MKRQLGGRTKSNLPFDSLMSVPIRRVGKDHAVREKKGLLSKTRGGIPHTFEQPINLSGTPDAGTATATKKTQRRRILSRMRLSRMRLPRMMHLHNQNSSAKPSLQDIRLQDIRENILNIAYDRNVEESFGRLQNLMDTPISFPSDSNEPIANIIFDSIASRTYPELENVTPLQHVITTIKKKQSHTIGLLRNDYLEQFNHSYRQLLRINYRNIILLFSLMMETNINAHLLIFHIADIIHYYCSKLDTYVNRLYERYTCDILEYVEIQQVHFIIGKSFKNLNDAEAAGQGAALRVEEYDNALTLAIGGFKFLYEYNDVKHLQEVNINYLIEMLTDFTNKLLLYTNNSDKIINAFIIVYQLFKSDSSNDKIINIIKPFITNERIKTIITRNYSTEIDFVEKTLNPQISV